MMRIIPTVAALLLIGFATAQEHPSPVKHWQLTDSETLWIGRYSNCQYGYYVLLPAGVVAHSELPPNPHHGFVVKLPDIGVRTEVTSDNNADRLIWVNAEYNVTEESTLGGIANYEIGLTKSNKQNFKLTERKRIMLQSKPAVGFKVEYDTPKGRVVEEEIVAIRHGIIYEFGVKTNRDDYPEDAQELRRILAGVRFFRVPKGECSND